MKSAHDSLRLIADRLADERAAAHSIVATLDASSETTWDRPLPESWRTLGFVQELTHAAADVLERNPAHSRALAQFALAISTAVRPSDYPAITIAQLEGQAWKTLGTAHRYLSSHDAALRAYDAARRRFAEFGALADEEAAVVLAIAVVFSEIGKFDEALQLIAETAPVFSSFSDEKHLVQGALLKAMIHHRRGDLRLARIAYEDALIAAQQRDDLHTLAAIQNNLGYVLIELDEISAAADSLARARDLFAGLEMPLEVSRSEGGLARLLVHNREYERALALLRRVRQHFLSLGMIDEAGVAALDMIDALVATDDRAAAQQLAETVLAEFRAARLDRAIIALAYLQELLRQHPSPNASIRHVRSYIEQLRSDPARVFVPLPE
jgi:tetratricopeptide (TPR) repeat protein